MSTRGEPARTADARRAAEWIVERVGKNLRMAVPIGIGKPNTLLNALYRLAEANPSISLEIFTGLTLARPPYKSLIEKRFVDPLLDRLFPTYPQPLYVEALRKNALPPNITINEFFLQAGAWVGNGPVQRGYTSINYSHVAGHLMRNKVNVLAQLVAPPPGPDAQHYSLGSNTDVTLDLMDYVAAQREAGQPIATIGECHPGMPYMPGLAEVDAREFDILLEFGGEPYSLFAPPKQPVSLTHYAMALHAATMIKDGGTLQIGIGSFSDALVHALALRQKHNDVFRRLLTDLGAPLHPDAQLDPFTTGLYGCTELFVDGYLALKDAGILKRRVASPEGEHILHAGFFIGNRSFYERLAAMPLAERAEIAMCAISYTNTLRGDAARKTQERQLARFVNSAMVVTLLGAASSDALGDGRVVSGVGGQLDLVAMAHELPDARSIIAVPSWRMHKRRPTSNLVWSYANATVPRSLRDVVVTEYGIADLKGRSDRDTVAALLAVTDSRFHRQLLESARAAGKLEANFQVSPTAANNSPARINRALSDAKAQGHLPAFPLGSEMNSVEQALIAPLQRLENATIVDLLRLLGRGALAQIQPGEEARIKRLGLRNAQTLKERALRALMIAAMRD